MYTNINQKKYFFDLFGIPLRDGLAANKKGITIKTDDGDGWTTCDGCITLYKNGELVDKQDYLSSERITESRKISKAYKKATYKVIYPKDKADYRHKYDSLKLLPSTYPTRYHLINENKDAIWVYEY